MSRLQERFLDCSNLTLEEAEALGRDLIWYQQGINFWIGDLERYAAHRWPEIHDQIWPEGARLGVVQRAAGVCRAYPTAEDREAPATYSQYRQVAKEPDRLQRLWTMVEEGKTTDESRKDVRAEREGGPRWLLAVDMNYWLYRTWATAPEPDTAKTVTEWLGRLVNRLKESSGLTDVLCCFDSPKSFRKELTKDWEKKYKDRPPKANEYREQVVIARQLLTRQGFCCESQEGMEADDIMASAAAQFDGRVTLLAVDKDLHQCLGPTCNMLKSIEWEENPESGDMVPVYGWYTSTPPKRIQYLREELFEAQLRNDEKKYIELSDRLKGYPKNSVEDQYGIEPYQWVEYQTLMGDSADDIQGAKGIGPKTAVELLERFVCIEDAIQAAKDGDERITKKRRESLIGFESRLEVTRQLVTLLTDLPIPKGTRLA